MDERLQALINKGYDRDLVIHLSSFSEIDINSNIDLLMDEAKDKAKPSTAPHIYFVGGQPGSGKSSAMNRISEMESNFGVVNVEMDAYRTMNPKINDIKKTIFNYYKDKDFPNKTELMSSDLVAFTQGFADAVADEYTAQLFANGYNMAIESTLRHPEGKLKLAEEMRKLNPNCTVSVIMMGISHDVALDGAMSRAQQMEICLNKLISDAKEKEIEILPVSRGVVNEKYYDSVCADLPGSVEVFSDPKNSDILNGNVQIQDRSGNIHYDRNMDGLSKSASQIEHDSLHGQIAQVQIEENKQQVEKFFGVGAFMKENTSSVASVYGSSEEAKKIFEAEVQKMRELLAQQTNEYLQATNYQVTSSEVFGRGM